MKIQLTDGKVFEGTVIDFLNMHATEARYSYGSGICELFIDDPRHNDCIIKIAEIDINDCYNVFVQRFDKDADDEQQLKMLITFAKEKLINEHMFKFDNFWDEDRKEPYPTIYTYLNY